MDFMHTKMPLICF